jgi:transcriptional regulator with XRE-family HTH domain
VVSRLVTTLSDRTSIIALVEEWSRQRFGPALKALLDEQGMSLRELAERLGLSHAHLSRVGREVGGRRPSVDLMVRISRVLRVQPEVFYEFRLDAVIQRLDGETETVDRLYKDFFSGRAPGAGSRRRRKRQKRGT